MLISSIFCQSQTHMFQNFSYSYIYYNDSVDNQAYLDTVVITFSFNKKYNKRIKDIGRLHFSLSTYNDSVETCVSSILIRNFIAVKENGIRVFNDSLSFRSLYGSTLAKVANNSIITVKIYVRDIKVEEFEEMVFGSQYNSTYHEYNNVQADFSNIYFGRIGDKNLYSSKNRKSILYER